MKGEHQQYIGNDNQDGDEELNSSLTICKTVESQEEEKAEEEETMANLPLSHQSHTSDIQHKLKLIVRSQYWGRELKGRTCRNVYTNMNVKAPLVITSQAVLYNTDGFWGCCPTQGKRVLELQGYHFSDACEGCHWDLYLVGTWVSPTQSIHDFFLLPQDQTSVDIKRNERLNGWSFFGTCNVNMIRSGIDDMLHDLLLQNDAYGHRYHHVHIDIMIDKAFDRETPRSRKVNNGKARAERNKNMDSIPNNSKRQESSVTTEATASTGQESPPSAASKASNVSKPFATKVVGAAPPIPRLITNDSVPYLVPMPHSMANPVVGYQDARWTGEATNWNHDQFSVPSCSDLITGRSGQVASGSEYQGMYWHPAKGMSLPGGMPQQHSYWHHAHGAPFATATQQPYYHLPDMQMHQYHQHQSMAQVGIQHPHHHHLSSKMQHCNIAFSENHHYAGINTAPESSFCADPSMVCSEITEGSNIKFLANSLANVSMSDDSAFPSSFPGSGSSPPDLPSTLPALAPLDTVDVSPVAATKTPSIVPSGSRMSFPRPSSMALDTTVGGPPIDVTTSTTTTAELRGIPTPVSY